MVMTMLGNSRGNGYYNMVAAALWSVVHRVEVVSLYIGVQAIAGNGKKTDLVTASLS